MTHRIPRILTSIALGIGILFVASIAYAEENTPAQANMVDHKQNNIREHMEVKRTQALEKRDHMRADAEQKRKNAVEKVEVKRVEIQNRIDARKKEMMKEDTAEPDHKGTKREDIATRRAEIEGRITEKRANFEEKKAEREINRTEKKAEIAERLKERTSARAEMFLNRFNEILEAAIGRMYTLSDRIAARAETLAANGVDTSIAQEYLDLAVSELEAAESALRGTEADLDAALALENATRDDIKDIFNQTKTTLDNAKGHIRAAHQALKDAVAALKDAAQVVNTINQDTTTNSE